MKNEELFIEKRDKTLDLRLLTVYKNFLIFTFAY